MDLRFLFDNLLVVIVLFKTRAEQSSAYTSLQTAVNFLAVSPEVFIYDNSPEPASVAGTLVTYVHDRQNSGVSKAYNTASIYAGKKGKSWMLLLDQDTRLEPLHLQKMALEVMEHPHSLAFVPRMVDVKGLISPFYFSAGRGKRIQTCVPSPSLENYRFINSGLLIRHSAFVEAGGYNESIPLDFSDICFGGRLQKVTDHFRVMDITVLHVFSDNERIPVDAALRRFTHFCTGAFAMGSNSGASLLYFMRAFLHGCRLCLRYRDVRFLLRLFQYG